MRRKPITAASLATVGLVGAALAIFTQNAVGTIRSDTWDDGAVVVESVCLFPLPDGGAAGRVKAHSVLTDGGVGPRDKPVQGELTGARRTTALSVLADGQTIWNNAQ